MKRALLLSLFTLSGCLNFDELLDAGCARDASWAECGMSPWTPEGDGGFCSSSGWCWENPALPGAVDLFAVWGTSDNDVWVAGSGGAVLRFNGTSWSQVDVVLNPEPFSLIQPEPAVRAVVIDDAGVAWLAGEAMPVVGLSRAGVTRAGSVANRIGAATFAGRSYFLPEGSAPFSIEELQAGSLISVDVPLATGADNLTSITATRDGVLIAYDRMGPNTAQVFSLNSMTPTTLSTSAMGEVHDPRNFARHGAVEALVCLNGDAFDSSGGNAWAYQGKAVLPGQQDVRTHAIASLADGGARWWFAGGQGSIGWTETGLGSGLTISPGTPSAVLQSSWVSPSGHFWAVGNAGAVVEASPSGAVVTRGSLGDSVLVALAVGSNKTVAVGRGGVMLTRDAQRRTWSRSLSMGQSDLCAVSVGPLGTCTLDLGGEVVCDEVSLTTVNAVRSDGGGLFFGGERGGCALAQRPDGGAVAARGNSFSVYSGGAWSTFDAGMVFNDHLAELLLTPTGFTAALNRVDLESGSEAAVSGAVLTWEGATPRFCTLATPVLGMARTANGYLVVGPGAVGECSSNGTFTAVPTPLRRWVSAWVDPSGTWWILDASGVLLSRPAGAGAWVRERLPLGESALEGPETVRITGTDEELFILGKSGTILRRRLP